MATQYQIIVRNPAGTKLAEIERFSKLEYVLVENDVGALVLTMPRNLPSNWLMRDTRIEVWRQIDGGLPYLEGDKVWFVRQPARIMDTQGQTTHILTAYDAKDLLRRRIVAYKSGVSQAQKTGTYDNILKAIVRENMGSSAVDVTRDLSNYLTVASDLSACSTLTKAFSFRNVLTAMQDLAAASAEAGTYLSFDIVRTSDVMMEFRTFTGQRGVDHRAIVSGRPVVVAPETGSIVEPSDTNNYVQEITRAYAAGMGEGVDRSLVAVTDTRSTASPFNLIETFLDMNNQQDSALTPAAYEAVRNGRPRRTFSGRLAESKGVRYGRDYKWGDLITVQWGNVSYGVRVNPVHMTITDGEAIDTVLSGDELI